jgi:hypothetical protein
VLSFAGVDKVFVVQDGKAKEVRVALGGRTGDWIEVVSGLSGKESVVVAGTSRLATGIPVEVKPAATSPARVKAQAEADAKVQPGSPRAGESQHRL